MSFVTCDHGVLAPRSSILRPRSSGSNDKIRYANPRGVPNAPHRIPLGWPSQARAFVLTLLVAVVAFPATVAAAPPPLFRPNVHVESRLQARQNNSTSGPNSGNNNNNNNSSSNNNGSLSMNVWLPILLLAIVFALFSFCACIRRCSAGDAASRNNATTGNGAAANAAGARPRRRPRRTPSQISTKSLPPYMKEPGDLELVLFRGPEEGEDDQAPPHGMPTLAEDEDEHPEMHGAAYDVALDRMASMDTMADSSTNLIRRASESVPRPPELHHAPQSHGHHRRSADAHSLDSIGSEAELLAAHQRTISVDNPADPRGAAPAYTEAVPMEGGMATISLNDPEPNTVSSDTLPADVAAGRARSRFSFLRHNPFGSHNNAGTPQPTPPESSMQHTRSGSALSRLSSRESHESHSREHSNSNYNVSHSHSNSALFRAFRSHSPAMHAGSSTISLDSISAPLTHTVKRAEFHAPKGGLLTAEQVKLITSREGLERFGVPYGVDAIAAFSREKLAGIPPPDFESITGEHPEQAGADGGSGATDHPESNSDDAQPQRSETHSPASHTSSYATAESEEGHREVAVPAQTVQIPAPEDENDTDGPDDPRTARPVTPTTARPLSVSGTVSKRE